MKDLFELAEEQYIRIEYDYIKPPHLGLYIAGHGAPLIILDKSLRADRLLHKCILSEELGHHFTSAGNTVYQSACGSFWLRQLSKTEEKALRWSALRLAPDEKLTAVIQSGITAEYQLAEALDITTELLLYRLKIYQIKGILARREKYGQQRLFETNGDVL